MAVNLNVISMFNSKGLRAAQNELDETAKKTKSTSDKMRHASGAMFTSLAGIGAGIGGFAVDATAKLEDANVQLENAFKNAGTSMDDQKGKLEEVTSQMAKFGYTGAETEGALARLTTVTGSAPKALASMGLAADIAKNRHIDLTKAGDMMAKAMAGSTTAAKKMGIAIPDSVNKIKDPAKKSAAIMEILQGHFKGSAAAAAGTFGGQMEAAKAQVTDMAAKIGSKLVPMIMKIVGALMSAAKWIGKHREIMIGLLIAVGLALGVMVVMWVFNTIAAMSFWAAATGGIIILVAALAAGIAWIVANWGKIWGWIKKTVTGVWHHIVGAFHAVIGWLGKNWPLILAIILGPFGLAVFFIIKHWHGILNFIKGVPKKIGNLLSKVGGFVKTAFEKVGNVILSPFKWAFNKIAHLWNSTVGKLHFKIPSWVPSIGGKGFSMPQLPEWKAVGGSVIGMKPYIVGEQGPELFVPGGSGSIVPNHRLGGMGGGTVVQNITITSNDPQQVVTALIRYQQRNGSIPMRGA